MILTAKFDRLLKTKENALLSFSIPLYQSEFELDNEKEYKLEITEIKSKRSLQQNKLMWALINKIAVQVGMSDNDVYCQIIEMANIKTVYLQTLPEVQKELEKVFRAVVEKDSRENEKGVITKIFKCYYGTSKFDTHEMNDFIDNMLRYASEVGIDIREYEI